MANYVLKFTAALIVLGVAAGPLQVHATQDHSAHQVHELPPAGTPVRFADVTLTDRQEHPVRLKDDLVADKIVVMGFIYTSCTTVCPVISAIMQKVQTQLGERVGAQVQLVSISVDPLRDTPARLREYSLRYRPGPGWAWLTGSVQAVTDTLKGLGTWSADFTDHQPVIMVGDGRSAQWTSFYGFTDPAVLVAKVEALSAARENGAHVAHQASIEQGVRP